MGWLIDGFVSLILTLAAAVLELWIAASMAVSTAIASIPIVAGAVALTVVQALVSAVTYGLLALAMVTVLVFCVRRVFAATS